MATIQNTELSFRDDNGDLYADITVYIEFSQREVEENFNYGVSVAVIRDNPQVVVIPRRNSPASMTLYVIPPNASGNIQLTYDNQTIKPDGSTTRRVSLTGLVNNRPTAGTMAKAVSVVAPEFADVEGQSASVATV